MFVSKRSLGRYLMALPFVTLLALALFSPLVAMQSSNWTSLDRQSFTFLYPPGWQVQEESKNSFDSDYVNDPASPRMVGMMFHRGVENHPNLLNQCAGVDEYIDHFYQATFAPMATGTHQYPYTTVTHDDYKPGWMGGRSTWITVVHVEAYQPPATVEYWVNVVPRQGGFYTIVYRHPSEPMQISESFRQRFLQGIVLKAPPLGKDAYCNYLGK